ncbi:Aspartate--ammonia ligase [Mycoplasmopsis californica]|uniref:Aspartate--ammonia ligase n=1 Tax=Mycoplasmopsis equigenitalium TaxID=114883 RepID=A0ABY5J349_9BACT|nr:amino acid--tRNA ligase-related protein [Mycoplasmopsis equigenitalium]UUD36956.1 aspartate--ammonia ligase [Mycoplasmopsis equigenitalium]VEU69749.1 Aspartate--ammonia ligase [Mycoplasmopsis californica]
MYKSKLDVRQTQEAIHLIKKHFQKTFSKKLCLIRASAPLFVDSQLKINDYLNGEKPVRFTAKGFENKFEILHSLAKWKRVALKKYNIPTYEGIYTDMNAIRREEDLDYLHSFYVDQWDWEIHINKKDRNTSYLHKIVKKIYSVIKELEEYIIAKFPVLEQKLPQDLTIITSQELADIYPKLTPEEREREYVKTHKAIFISQIGHPLSDGVPHGKRAFDYDDWKFNGDLIFYDAVNDNAIEISSMGIRVDAKSLKIQQTTLEVEEDKLAPYHYAIFNKHLPFSIGGGIGQSRLCMFLLEKKHIGEVQSSFWPEDKIIEWKNEGIELL